MTQQRKTPKARPLSAYIKGKYGKSLNDPPGYRKACSLLIGNNYNKKDFNIK